MKTRIIGGAALAVAAATAAIVVVTTRGGSASTSVASQLARVRSATTAYHDVAAAQRAGYAKLLDCFESPAGGMGQHYVRTADLDARVEVSRPESMVYEVQQDKSLQLVAVEYIVPQKAWTSSTPPSLFGQSFHRNDKLGLWALHAWIYRTNPQGTFADFNPAVHPCPAA